jgi:hypothetical protein
LFVDAANARSQNQASLSSGNQVECSILSRFRVKCKLDWVLIRERHDNEDTVSRVI